MAKKVAYELYNPNLSIRDNASVLRCSEAAIRKFIKKASIDRRYDAQYSKWKKIQDFNRANPNVTYKEKSETLKMAVATIRKYEKMDEAELDMLHRDTDKVSNFDIKNVNCIKSISYSQDEILLWIMHLYNDDKPFECDLTYSKGNFYNKSVPQPQHKYDKYPQTEDTKKLEESDLLPDKQLNSIIYDLPFLISDGSTDFIIKDRFTHFFSAEEAYNVNDEMLSRAHRLLRKKGRLVVKTMDIAASGSRQYWISDYVLQKAKETGFRLKDKFILLAHHRLMHNLRKQRAARKFHSYFFVFEKK